MPFKIEIKSNYDLENVDIETCEELIKSLEHTYKIIRSDIYKKFLSFNRLLRALTISLLFLLLYFLTDTTLFLYFVPLCFFIIMLFYLLSAEMVSKTVRKQIRQSIKNFKNKLKSLKRKEAESH